jgi:hypothetical protein
MWPKNNAGTTMAMSQKTVSIASPPRFEETNSETLADYGVLHTRDHFGGRVCFQSITWGGESVHKATNTLARIGRFHSRPATDRLAFVIHPQLRSFLDDDH